MKTITASVKILGSQSKSVEVTIEPGGWNDRPAIVVSPGPQHDYLKDAEIEVWVVAPAEDGEEVRVEDISFELEESSLNVEGLRQWGEFFAAVEVIASNFEMYCAQVGKAPSAAGEALDEP